MTRVLRAEKRVLNALKKKLFNLLMKMQESDSHIKDLYVHIYMYV